MRIVVDGGTWTNRRGYGRFTRELLRAAATDGSPHEFVLVADQSVALESVPPRIRIVRVPVSQSPSEAASADGRRSLRDMWAMSRALTGQRPECIFFPSVYTFVPVATRAPVVVCIHDVIPERLPGLVFPTRRSRLFWRVKVALALRQAARIVTVSEHARRGIADEFGLRRESIGIIPEAAAAAFSPEADPETGRRALERIGLARDVRFLLYVGGLAPHKNLIALVDAVADLRRRPPLSDVVLLIVGDYTGDVFYSAYPQLRRRLDQHDAGAVRLTGPLPDVDVAGLLRLAQALVLPSFEEGLGLPGLEAAACGAAVVATRFSALPDLLGDGAALFIDPNDPAALTNALTRVLTDAPLRAELGARAAERVRAYTWPAAASELLAVLTAARG